MKTIDKTGNWIKTKNLLRQKFALLIETDLRQNEGRKEEMLDRLQIKLGKSKEELQKIIGAI